MSAQTFYTAPMVLIMIYDSHIQSFSKRIPSYASFNRIWISLRFIHIEIYFSKEHKCEMPKPPRNMTILTDANQYQDWPSHPQRRKRKKQNSTKISDKHNESIDRKSQNLFILYGIVCHINKGCTYSDERAPFGASWFYLILMFLIFYHICGFLWYVQMPWMRRYLCDDIGEGIQFIDLWSKNTEIWHILQL